jgi:hypothetical protein
MIAWDLQPQRRRPGGHLGDGGAHGACNGSAAAGVKSGLSRSLFMLAAAARQFVLPADPHTARREEALTCSLELSGPVGDKR